MGEWAAVELFQTIIAPPLEKRRDEWMGNVANGLRQLEQNNKLNLKNLSENPAFIDAVMHATQVALRTSQEEKLWALQNAILNTALPTPIDDALQHIFINLIDEMTVWHLRLLSFLADPTEWFKTYGKIPPQMIMGGLFHALSTAYPYLAGDREFCDQITKDLSRRGLITTETLHNTTTNGGLHLKWTSPMEINLFSLLNRHHNFVFSGA